MAGGVDGPPRLEMRGVRKRFGATVALDGVDFHVNPGEVHALLGENGAGKSTLMKVLSGAVSPDEGELSLDGAPYRPRDPLIGRRSGVAMIYQELSLARHLTVEENILLGVEPSRAGFLNRREIRRRSEAALADLGHADLPLDVRVSVLPVAVQQVVEIARALAVGCRVLVLDEPTSSLSRPDAEHLFAVIERLRGQGQGVVYISHFIEEAKRIADRFTVLRDGRSVGGGAMAEATPGQIVGMMVGRKMDQLFPRSPRRPGDPLLDLDRLSGLEKPHEASLTLRRGEVLGIAGLVGAGRTELLRAVFGLDPIRCGAVRMGAFVGPASPARRWAQGMGLLSEDRKNEGLALGLTLADNMTLTRLSRFVSPGRLLGETRRWIDTLSIRCREPGQRAGDLSGGNQQKIALARLLHHDVDVFLLDEPTKGIDVASKAQIYGLIDQVVAGDSRAVLMVSSYLPELLGVCDRVAVLSRGRLGPARPVEELTEHTLMVEAMGGEHAA